MPGSGSGSPSPIQAAIATRDTAAFFEALEGIEAATRDVPLARLPEPLRMIRVLFYLQMGADIDGITGFLNQYPEEVGAYTSDAERWCRRIGADRAAEYLARAAALFPGGHIPTEFFERADAMSEIDDDEPTPFEQLDREYAEAYPQLAMKLRAYLKLHEHELEEAIATARQIGAQMRTLPAVLGVTDDVGFFEALGDMVKTSDSDLYLSLTEMSPPIRVVTVLRTLRLVVGANGIWQFLANEDVGHYVHTAEAWCRHIGAQRAADYLAETASVFPGGRVPEDAEERNSIVEQIDEDWARRRAASPSDPSLKRDALGMLDIKHEGAVEEMTESLRAYLRANATNAEDSREALTRIADADK